MPSSVPGPGRRRGPSQPDERPRVATPTDVSAAIAHRRRQEQRRQRLMFSAVGALLVLALVAAWVVRFSSVFAVRDVEVQGTQRLTPAQVLQVAQVPLGEPLVQVDTQAIGDRVVRQLAPAQAVSVHTSFPHRLVIDVTERTPVYQRVVSNQYQLVDASGVIFALESRPTKGLIRVTTASVDNRLLAEVSVIIAALPDSIRKRVQGIDARTPDEVTLQLDKGQRVVWGSSDASADKARVLLVLIGQKATVFDVSSPGYPTTR